MLVLVSVNVMVQSVEKPTIEYLSYLQGNESVQVTQICEGLFLAEQGVDCFLVEMPCNLAVLGQNQAEEIMDAYDYENWYLSGHSMGGAMVASYTAAHMHKIDGLILLAAYFTKSLEQDGFVVLSLYGSEDGVLNQEKLVEGRRFMPESYTEVCIEGGNHAWFGNYGEQEGDLPATINREEH